ncbi:hypothetical protein AGMMS50249_0750 [candidate division SR1 bacterium]|nr:hypothetical protein AGMMS50249_0750 [candidate division SR1 bacterium]
MKNNKKSTKKEKAEYAILLIILIIATIYNFNHCSSQLNAQETNSQEVRLDLTTELTQRVVEHFPDIQPHRIFFRIASGQADSVESEEHTFEDIWFENEILVYIIKDYSKGSLSEFWYEECFFFGTWEKIHGTITLLPDGNGNKLYQGYLNYKKK